MPFCFKGGDFMQMHRTLKEEDKLNGININCEACGKNYDVQVKKEG